MLQTLIKQHETTIVSKKKEHFSEKDKLRDLQKKIAQINKEKNVFKKHLAIFASIVFETKKLKRKKKGIFENYKNSSLYKADEVFSDDEIESAVTSPFDSREFLNNNSLQDLNSTIQVNEKEFEKLADNINKSLFELDTIGIGSIDTGRGSSIASSPPEYFPDSPLNVEDVRNKTKFIDSGTSPLRCEFTNTASSPINVRNKPILIDSGTSPLRCELTNTASSPINVRNKPKLIDSGTSPLRCEFTNTASSPIMFKHLSPTRKPQKGVADNLTNPKIMLNRAVSPIDWTDSLTLVKSANDQTTPPVSHNEKKKHDENNDWEIELILGNMRLEHSLITPMPSSPSRLSDIENRSMSTILEACEDEDVATLQHDNKKLQSDMVLIKKEMIKLKRFVQSMNLDDEFNRFMNVSLINDINVEMENPVSPLYSIDNDDNITLDSESSSPDHVTDVPVNNDDVLLAEPGEEQLETSTGKQDSSKVECTENYQVPSIKDCKDRKKMAKARKISKLDKLRKRMLPKSKIGRPVDSPKKLLRSMARPLSFCKRLSPILSEEEEAYAKAVLIWKQLNSKKKVTCEKDNAKRPITKETKKPNEDVNKIQSNNILSPNKFDNQLNNSSQLLKQTNKSRKKSAISSGNESYGIKTRKSSISLPECPVADDKNINSLDSDKALFVVLELSLSEKVEMLQKQQADILNIINNTVKSPRGAKSPKVNPTAETEALSKRILRSSLTSQRNEDTANKSKTDNVILGSDIDSPPKTNPVNMKMNTRISLRRASQESKEGSDEEIISNNKETLSANVTTREIRGQRKQVNKTQVQCRRTLRSSNQLPDSPNSPESQNLCSSVHDTCTEQFTVPSQRQGYQSTSTVNTISCSGTNSPRSSIQQSDKYAPQVDRDKIDNDTSPLKRTARKRKRQDIAEIQSKRTLRSSAVVLPNTNNDIMENIPSSATNNEMLHKDKVKSVMDDTKKETQKNLRNNKQQCNAKNNLDSTGNKHINASTATNATTNIKDSTVFLPCLENLSNKHSTQVTCYEASEEPKESDNGKHIHENDTSVSRNSIIDNRQNSVLCKGIEKYGFINNKNHKKLPDAVLDTISKKLEDSIAQVIKLPARDRIPGMNKLVEDISYFKETHFIAGLMKYLSNPARKNELFNKDNVHPAPSMSKPEQVLLYILNKLKRQWPNVHDSLLKNIEYTLFRLNRTPPFEIIESMSHFYAVVCRYINDKSRLRLFLISAMYCIQFKSYPLIKQCLEVWMHILPLAHMGMAKSPLVTCCIYLLHFYKCEDKYNRVQDIRNILAKTYFYKTTEWNEPRILEMFKSAIIDLRDSPIERKMLRLALIILAKRHGARWCQNNIIKNILKPLIDKENVPERTKAFCISVLGALLKPYPMDMKVHCEIAINELLDMLKGDPSPTIQEAIFFSLIKLNKHNQTRVVQALLSWCPQTVSQDMKEVIKDYVKEKPVKVWKSILSRVHLAE